MGQISVNKCIVGHKIRFACYIFVEAVSFAHLSVSGPNMPRLNAYNCTRGRQCLLGMTGPPGGIPILIYQSRTTYPLAVIDVAGTELAQANMLSKSTHIRFRVFCRSFHEV
jgi:hypothetical protein